ncbi:collagen alpha-6(VI) chain-like isoform X1 [Gopherus evgoodei]|uniref:collagen alpha-6(VI) chain-like isoform X1 n=2 Tax=Gopherus evgoodei TaxID=1825980 RepID=UPI0011CFD4E5|nr:collagen alpha-6(VI) chain-like isoform X1 [Gopherus evgoodei]
MLKVKSELKLGTFIHNMKMLLTLFLFLIGSQTSITQTPGPTSADIVLLVDSSNSLGNKAFPSMKSFINKMISHLTATPNQYRIALAQYSDDLHVEFRLDTYKAKNPMLNHVKKNVVFKGGSIKTGNALREVHETYFKGPTSGRDKERILVILTSGKSEDAVGEPARILKSDGVKIIALGIQDVSPRELQSMATPQFSYTFRTVRDLSMSSQNMTKIIEDVIQTDINDIIPTVKTTSVPEREVCKSDSVADVVFIVDEGVSKPKSEDIKNFLQGTVSFLDVKKNCTKIGLVTYSSEPHVLALLSEETNETAILQKIQGFSPREGKANTGAAIKATRKNIFSVKYGSRKAQGIEQIAILITHRPSEDNVSEAARDLRRTGVTVFTIGIENANNTQLTQIASYPPQLYATKLTAFSDLPKQARTLQKKLLNQIQDKQYVQSERRELLKTGCVDTEEADIYVLIDGSTSIYPVDFGDIKKFLKEVIKMFNIGLNKVRFGAVQFSQSRSLEFELDEYSKRDDLETAIDNIRQIYGNTYIGEALTFMQPLFKKAREQRAGRVPCHLIVLTDGKSHDSVKESAERLRSEMVNIYAIGVKDADEAQLLEIAGSKSRTYFVQEFDSLKNIKNEIVQGICSGEACKEMTADIMFLVDSSGSIGPENFSKMKNFMRELVNKSDISRDRVQVGVVQFSDIKKEEFQLNQYSSKSDIFSAIDKMSLIGETTLTGGALTFVADYFRPPKGARPAVRKILILITDGEARDAVESPAKALRDQGVVIYSVGVFNANKTQLEEISGKHELVFYIENFDILKHIEDEIIFGICTPHEECKRIERLDVVFVIDGSGSINSSEYQTMKDFMIALVNRSDVGPDRVQFGAVKYSGEPETFFYLNKYTTKSEIVKAIQNDATLGGSTYTAKAIGYSEALFAQEHGGRKSKGVPQILIVITDGDSHDKAQLGDTAKRLRDNGIIIYAVGIEGADITELLAMAGSEDKYYYVDTFEGLKNTSVAISEKVCNDSKPECEIQADLVFLIDGSSSIDQTDFTRMKDFLKNVLDQIYYDHNVQIGIAQYSDKYKREFGLGTFQSKSELNNQIQNIKQMTGTTLIGAALKQVKEFFAPARTRRVTRNVRPVLLVVTDGKSYDDVAEPAEDLRKEGVNTYAIGVGDIDHSQLMQIAGIPERKYTVRDFKELKIIKKRLVGDLCKPDIPTTCFVDIVMGFDISSQKRGDRLFQGQYQLETYLPNMLKALTSLSSLSCSVGTKTQSSVAVYLNNTITPVSSKFQFDSEKIWNSLRESLIDKPSHLNGNFLESLWKTFPSKADDQNRRKVLLVFSDGLDEDVEELEQKSEELRKKGLDALITVVLEGASKIDELQYIEFGKGFEYMTQLTIGKRNIDKALSKYVTNVAERTCCAVFCKCIGEEGGIGRRGKQGNEGPKGIKGSQGHLGEEGEPGSRGLPGPMGEQGNKGCDGSKGPKGYQGMPGEKGDDGDSGIDGINGEQGSLGYPGKMGEKGDPGYMGSPGPRGLPGDRGEKGLRGDHGDPGLDNDIAGTKGSKGEQGSQGERGPVGLPGSPGSSRTTGAKGRRGTPGPQGEEGAPGSKGFPGEPGFPGSQGQRGIRGVKGERGSEGSKGLQGELGASGPKGSPGSPGMRGNKGEYGDPGETGQRGPPGQRGMQGDDGAAGYGGPGEKGAKGQEGFTGDIGRKGGIGDPGPPGEPGPKGIRGKMGTAGPFGLKGFPGDKGFPGHRGAKGTMGLHPFPPCEVIDYVRRHSPCWQEKPECPVYPTELVFALDISQDVTSQLFERMREIVISVVKATKIRDSNCPVGARVAVVSYNSNTHYLIRFSEFYGKNQLLNKFNNLAYERSSSERDIAGAMRFVARNVFKRTRQGPNVRKIAVFFSNGPSADESSLNTAVLEYTAFSIVPVVIAFNDVPLLRRAFTMDDTGFFQIININQEDDYEPFLETFQRCTLCYDKCKPDEFCERRRPQSPPAYVDAAFLLDSSQKISGAEFENVKNFLSRVLDNFDISSEPQTSSTGDRVAVVSHAPPGFKLRPGRSPVKKEFDFVTYSSSQLMKGHIEESVRQLNGAAALGHAIQWTIDNVFLTAPHSRQHKAIFVISAGETSQWDKDILKKASLRAKCEGYALFVISLGHVYNDTELEDLASIPLEHHLIQLGRVHKPELEYVVRFIKPFVHLLRRASNKYPPVELRRICTRARSLKPEYALRSQQHVSIIDEDWSGGDAIADAEYSVSGHATLMFQDDVRDGPLNTNSFASSTHQSLVTTDIMETAAKTHGREDNMAGTKVF